MTRISKFVAIVLAFFQSSGLPSQPARKKPLLSLPLLR